MGKGKLTKKSAPFSLVCRMWLQEGHPGVGPFINSEGRELSEAELPDFAVYYAFEELWQSATRKRAKAIEGIEKDVAREDFLKAWRAMYPEDPFQVTYNPN